LVFRLSFTLSFSFLLGVKLMRHFISKNYGPL
jgi:hypothetical protein